jgi:type I restriction enzyme S subunit
MEVRKGYKQTEVGVIPEDWEIVLLENLSTRIGDGIHSTPQYDDSGEYFFVNGNNLKNGEIFISDETKKVSKIEYQLHRRDLNNTTVLLSINGTIGNIAFYNNEKIVLGKSAAYININDKIDKQYFYQLIQTKAINLYFDNELTGSTIKNLGLGSIRNTPIPLPPTKSEQTAIATALSDTNALIGSLEKLIAKKQAIKQGAMQELLRPKEGWEVKKLGEIAEIVRGASPRPIEEPKWFDENSKIGWVRISDVTKSKKVLLETTQKLSELGVKNSRLVENGNLIMSICATVGRPILTTFDVCIHDGFVVFRNPKIDKIYLYYYLSFIEKDWSKNGQTGSQMNLNTNLINETEIQFPSKKNEQIRIATILSDMDAEITGLEDKLSKYKQVKLGMMQELLTGRVRLI